MSQPGGPPWRPGAYVPPTPYGSEPAPVDGPPPPPPANRPGWWLAGGAVLLVLALLLAVLLADGPRERPDAAGPTATLAPAPGPAPAPAPAPGPSGPGPEVGRYPGSEDVAQRWLDALAAGDAQAAFDLSCPRLQASSAGSAAGGDPAETLATYFADLVLGGGGFTAAVPDGVRYDPASGDDVVTFVLTTDDGPRPVEISVIMEGTVCDFR